MTRAASPLAGAALAAAVLLWAAPAWAQASGCEESQKLLGERKDLMQRVNGLGKKIDPGAACSLFTKLAGNGAATIKWLEANKDWCSVPDDFVAGFKKDHQQVSAFKGKACQAASQQATMLKQQKEAQQAGGGGLLGGPGLTGEYKLPKGAL